MTEKGLFMRRFVPFLTLFFLLFWLCSCEVTGDYVFLISEGTRETVSAPTEGRETSVVSETRDSVDTTHSPSSAPPPSDTDGDEGESAETIDTEGSENEPPITTEAETNETEPTETTSPVTVPATTKAPTSEPATTETTKQPTTTTPDTVAPPAEEGDIVLLSITETVPRGKTATLSIRGIPYETYRIEVYYSTTVSSAKGLEPKAADANGTVTWSWKVGTRTKSGSHRIVIRGENGETLNLSFTTTE